MALASFVRPDAGLLSRPVLSNEFLLAAACCRWPSARSRQAVEINGARKIDWQRFLRVVRRQRVEGLVHHGLTAAKLRVPADVASALGHAASQIARQNLAFAAESIRLQRLFQAANLPLLFVKGVSLSMLAYGTLASKRSWDIDVAVPEERLLEACDVLVRAGFHRLEPDPQLSDQQFATWVALSKESIWQRGETGVVVELHSGLVDNARLLEGIDACSPQQRVTILPGCALPTLQTPDLFSYLCVHGATHAWSRLKWIADVAALIAADRDEQIEELYRRSVRLGAGRCTAQALLLCSLLFGTRLPSALTEEFNRDRANRLLVRIALSAMAGRNEERELDNTVFGTLSIHLSHFLLSQGFRYKAAELKRKLVNPHDRATIALPKVLHLLYPIILAPSWLRRRIRGSLTG